MWKMCPVRIIYNIFQIGQPIRLLLAYVGEDFEDVTYELGDGEIYFCLCFFGIH